MDMLHHAIAQIWLLRWPAAGILALAATMKLLFWVDARFFNRSIERDWEATSDEDKADIISW